MVTVTAREERTDALLPLTASVDVTITVTTGGGGGGGGGGGFGPGPGEIQLVVTAAVVGEEAPPGQRFGFAFHCNPARGRAGERLDVLRRRGAGTGPLRPGRDSLHPDGHRRRRRDAVDGLFTDRVLGEENLRIVVTFTYGIVTTAVDPATETVVEEDDVALTIPGGSRDAPYSVLLETDSDSCAAALDLDGESLACHTVTLFDGDGAEETDVTLLVPRHDHDHARRARVEELGGIEGVRAARERGELRMRQRDDADTTLGGAAVHRRGDRRRRGRDRRLRAVVQRLLPDHRPAATAESRAARGLERRGDGADGASIPDALGDIAGQVDVIYQWLAETQTWRSHRPAGPPILSAFDTFTRGATYWIRSSEAVEWTIVGGPVEPPTAAPIRLHSGWTEVVWRGADGAAIAEAFGADVFPQVEVIYRWLAETQTWGSFRPGAPAFLNAFDTFAAGGSYWIAVAEAVEWVVAGGGSPTDP